MTIEHTDLSPEPTPRMETIVPTDPAFVEECKAHLPAIASDWRYGKSVMSCSVRWGLVWRADITSARVASARIVVWRMPDGGFGTAYLSRPYDPLPEQHVAP